MDLGKKKFFLKYHAFTVIANQNRYQNWDIFFQENAFEIPKWQWFWSGLTLQYHMMDASHCASWSVPPRLNTWSEFSSIKSDIILCNHNIEYMLQNMNIVFLSCYIYNLCHHNSKHHCVWWITITVPSRLNTWSEFSSIGSDKILYNYNRGYILYNMHAVFISCHIYSLCYHSSKHYPVWWIPITLLSRLKEWPEFSTSHTIKYNLMYMVPSQTIITTVHQTVMTGMDDDLLPIQCPAIT